MREANRLNMPVVAICDTNSDPDLVQWPIPGNDDAIRSVKLLVSLVTESIIAGRQRFLTQQPVAPQAAGPGAATNGAQAESTADAEGDAGSSTT